MTRRTKLLARARNLAVLAALTAAPAAAFASPPGPNPDGGMQARPTPEQHLERRFAELTTRLGLDARQQTEVRAILTDAKTRFEALRAQAQASGTDRHDPAVHAQFRAIHDQAEDRIWALLRCDQKDQMRLLEREHRAERFARGHSFPHGGGH